MSALLMTFFLIILSLLSLSRTESRQHGLEFENPAEPISPDAYAFFHPAALSPSPSPAAAQTKTLPLAATFQSTPAHDSTVSGSRRGLSPAGVAGISLSLAFVCLVGMGVYYSMSRKRAHLHRAIKGPKQMDSI